MDVLTEKDDFWRLGDEINKWRKMRALSRLREGIRKQ